MTSGKSAECTVAIVYLPPVRAMTSYGGPIESIGVPAGSDLISLKPSDLPEAVPSL
ncbi:MAG: hypothetical protein LAO21_19900 [Acidobacteriia bacterium]|nr:hypothetical protein [Terriglobia bacterium]